VKRTMFAVAYEGGDGGGVARCRRACALLVRSSNRERLVSVSAELPKRDGDSDCLSSGRRDHLTRHIPTNPGTKVQALDCVTPHSARLA
jgi:hypothetical protein